MKKILASLFLAASIVMLIAVPSHAKKRVSCIGDSITYGYGLENRETECYPTRLQYLLGAEYEVSNFGKSGATLLRHGHRPYIDQDEFRQAMQWGNADYIVIHLGVNDTDPRNWPNYRDEFVEDYLTLIDTLLATSPDAKVLVALLSPIGTSHYRFSSGTKQWEDEIQDAIRKVAEISGAMLIDFHTPLYPYPTHIPDAVHPDAFGAEILARTVYEAITGNYGGLSMSPLYTDNMVLQQGVPLDIHGKADAGEKVTVRLGGKKMSVTAGADGFWQAVFPARKASAKGITLSVSTPSRTLEFKDVLVGEVWLCSGQSNMEFTVAESSDVEPLADDAIRLYDMKGRWRPDYVEWPEEALKAVDNLDYFDKPVWAVCDSASSARFSAIAISFAVALRQELGVPVGLVCNAVGGSPTESWIGRQQLETGLPAIFADWYRNDYVMDWVRGRAAKNLGRNYGPYIRHPYQPSYLFETGIQPLDKYRIKGVLWYQGESNAHNFSTHEKLFPLLVDSWREALGDANLPFGYVQLSSLNRPSWPWFRDSQRRLLGCRSGLGMVVTSDLGDPQDVHYRNKKPVGERLALWALHDVYNKSKVVFSGPVFKSMKASGKKLTVSFHYAKGLAAADGELTGFEIAGSDGIFHPAIARIKGGTVVLTSDKVPAPVMVRYAWEPYTRANLVNGAGLPASTFREPVR